MVKAGWCLRFAQGVTGGLLGIAAVACAPGTGNTTSRGSTAATDESTTGERTTDKSTTGERTSPEGATEGASTKETSASSTGTSEGSSGPGSTDSEGVGPLAPAREPGGPKTGPRALVEELYAPAHVPTFELTMPESCRSFLENRDNETYCEGSLRYVPELEGAAMQVFPRVGIRLKGSLTFRPLAQKAAFKVRLDAYVPGTRLHGVRRLTFNNMVDDPTMAHEVMAYRVLRAVGVPAPLCNHARVFVNGVEYGLYANVESVDDEFVEHRFTKAPGDLYEPTGYGVDLVQGAIEANGYQHEVSPDPLPGEPPGDPFGSLRALIAAVNGPDVTFYDDAGRQLDWPSVLRAGAADALLAHWDDYFSGQNNYRVYRELDRDRFLILPWGTDQTFGLADVAPDDPLLLLRYRYDHSETWEGRGLIHRRCMLDVRCKAEYREVAGEVLDAWAQIPLADELEELLLRTQTLRENDPRQEHAPEKVARFVDGLRRFVAEREAIVRAQLADGR